MARKLAEIYKYLGVLRKGQLVEVDRSGLVRGYIGQTATQTQEVVEESLGGLLFVDEAYALNQSMSPMSTSDRRPWTPCSRPWRTTETTSWSSSPDTPTSWGSSSSPTPGLRSRFSNFVYFDDYTADELMQILEQNLAREEYPCSPRSRADRPAR